MRRVIIVVIVVSMAVLASTPVPACGLFFSQIAECETAQTQMQCDGMDMRMGVQDDVSHPSPSCCQPSVTSCLVSHLPPPVAQNKSGETVAPIARVSANAVANTLSIPKQSIPDLQWHEISPPRIQSLLCTFLI